MEPSQPPAISRSALGPVPGTGATPCSQPPVVLAKPASLASKWKANSWQAHSERLVEREAALKAEGDALQATIRALTQRLYGAKSEPASGPDGPGASKPTSLRTRGQPPGSPGPGRRERAALPVVAEGHDVSAAAKRGPVCGDACASCPGADASTLSAIQVQAHIRRMQRQRSHKTCPCPQGPGMVTAPPAPRLIPKRPRGVAVWTQVLLDPDLSGRPTYRCCAELRPHGLPVSPGTRTEGLRRIAGLVEPLMPALHKRQRSAQRFPGAATRGEGWEEGEGHTGHRWDLWVTHSASGVCDPRAPGRGADVPQAHGAKLPKDLVAVVLVCDRSSASTGLAPSGAQLMCASCWAQVRRDLLQAARRGPELDSGRWAWIDALRDLSRVHTARLKAWDDTVPREHHPAAFVERHGALKSPLSPMQTRWEGQLEAQDLHLATAKVLTRLRTHWDGLTVFVERPEVAMDPTTAERVLRHPVVGRKNS
jgi:transposase